MTRARRSTVLRCAITSGELPRPVVQKDAGDWASKDGRNDQVDVAIAVYVNRLEGDWTLGCDRKDDVRYGLFGELEIDFVRPSESEGPIGARNVRITISIEICDGNRPRKRPWR